MTVTNPKPEKTASELELAKDDLLFTIKQNVMHSDHKLLERAISNAIAQSKEDPETTSKDIEKRIIEEWYAFMVFVKNTQDLMAINPEDVEKHIGIKRMSIMQHEAQEVGWGSDEYWNRSMQKGQQADHNLCLALSLHSYEDLLKDARKIEEEYKMRPDQFDNVTTITDGKAVVLTTDSCCPIIDITLVCEMFETVAKCIDKETPDDQIDYDILANYFYGMGLEWLTENETYILPSLKIAVKKKQTGNS